MSGYLTMQVSMGYSKMEYLRGIQGKEIPLWNAVVKGDFIEKGAFMLNLQG